MKKLSIIILLFSTLALTSCNQSKEIDNMVYVLAIGVDRIDEDINSYTFQFAVPLNIGEGIKSGSGKENSDNPLYCISQEANSVYSAIDKVNEIISKEITLSHLKLILFSADRAKNGLSPFKENLLKDKNILPSVYTAVSLVSAKDCLNNISSPLELNPAKYYDLIFDNDYSSFSETAYVKDFWEKEDLTMPIIDFENEQPCALGVAMFKDLTLIDTLSYQEVCYLKMLRGTLNSVSLDFKNYNFTAKVKQKKLPAFTFNKNTLLTEYTIYISREIIPSGDKITANTKELVNKKIENHINLIFEKTQKNNCDILNIADKLKLQFIDLNSYNSFIKDLDLRKITFKAEIV